MTKLRAVIFDLDGVLVDTSVFHARAWANLVRDLGHEPPSGLEEQVKGISRMASLKIALGNMRPCTRTKSLQSWRRARTHAIWKRCKTLVPTISILA